MSRSSLPATLLAIALAGATLTSCAAQSTACGGQCTAPYELDVSFRANLTSQQDYIALERCTSDPAVVRVDMVTLADQSIQGHVFTTEFGKTAATTPLLACLRKQHEVLGSDYPD